MPKKFPPEFKRDVVTVTRRGDLTVAEVAADFDISVESVRRWMRQADIDDGVVGYESDFNFFAWPESCVQQLREFCWSAMSRLIAQLNGYNAELMGQLAIHSHTWFHVTRAGGYFGLHNHPMASWSGVYCVTPGEDDPQHPDSGQLCFNNPNQIAYMYVHPANNHMRAPYTMNGKTYRLRAGQLVLFPSWVSHEVLPYRGRGERITVAFNCWFRLPEQGG